MSKRYQAAILTASYNGLLVPNAPTIGTATAGSGSASVTFTAPSNVGGGAITSYTVISSPGGILGTGSSSPITVSGLTNDTAYTFTVVATNAYGSGPASAASNSVTPTVNYIENVFSTYLYTGNASSLTITNGIDLAGKGGLVWFKNRQNGDQGHVLVDTLRGQYGLTSNATVANEAIQNGTLSFNSNGFAFSGGLYTGSGDINGFNGNNYVSWTFREQEKFFDIVPHSAGASLTLNHALGVTPGFIIIKETTVGNWFVFHRSSNGYVFLNTTAAAAGTSMAGIGASTATAWIGATSTTIDFSNLYSSSSNFIAYLFAHDAGGFGASGNDNVVSCGSYTGNGSANGPTVTLGYEPQWFMVKNASGVSNWVILDNMRGVVTGGDDNPLFPNLSNAESSAGILSFNATGFNITSTSTAYNGNGSTYIYIAIRRGPMKIPTVGTSVFLPSTAGATTPFNVGFPPDLALWSVRDSTGNKEVSSRLQGGAELFTNSTAVEGSGYDIGWSANTNFWYQNVTGGSMINWMFRRAPSVCDVVCYTGAGVFPLTLNHNLGVTPELIFVKRRDSVRNWVGWQYQGSNGLTGTGQFLNLNLTAEANASTTYNDGYVYGVSATQFAVGEFSSSNNVNSSCIAYLFATCAGVSKVGSYTGTGALQTIACGFTTGARFVLIKRTDSTGDWFTYDSARGITSSNDPYLLLNTNAAEVTGTNYVDSTAAGFQVTAAAPAGLNAAGGTYIFLAIA